MKKQFKFYSIFTMSLCAVLKCYGGESFSFSFEQKKVKSNDFSCYELLTPQASEIEKKKLNKTLSFSDLIAQKKPYKTPGNFQCVLKVKENAGDGTQSLTLCIAPPCRIVRDSISIEGCGRMIVVSNDKNVSQVVYYSQNSESQKETATFKMGNKVFTLPQDSDANLKNTDLSQILSPKVFGSHMAGDKNVCGY